MENFCSENNYWDIAELFSFSINARPHMEAGIAKPTGASPGQAAFIGSASPTRQQVSWLADRRGAAPSHIGMQWQMRTAPRSQ